MKEFDICDKGIHKMNTVSSLVQVGCLRGVSQMNERRDWFRWTAAVSLRTFDDSISRCFEGQHLCIVVETGCAIYVQGKPLLFYLCGIIPCLVWV